MNGRQQAGKKFDTLEFTYGTKTPPQPLHRCTVQVRRRCATARNGRWRRSRVPGTVCQWRCRRELSCARDGRLKVGARSMSSTGRASGRGVQEEHHREDGVHWETAPLRFAGCMVQRSRTATTRVEFGDCNARCRSRASGSSPVKSVSSVCKFGADAYAGSTYCMVMTAGRTVLMHEECAGGRRIERMMHTKSDDAVEGAARRSASWGRRLRWCWDGVDKLGKAYEGGRRSRRMVEREKRAAFASNQATRAGQAGRGRPQGGQVADANYKGIGRRVIRGSDRLQIRPSEPHLHYLHALGAQIRRARLPACVRWRVRGRRIAEEARQSGGGRGGGGERARLDLEASRQPWGREKGRRAHHLRRVHATARGVVKKELERDSAPLSPAGCPVLERDCSPPGLDEGGDVVELIEWRWASRREVRRWMSAPYSLASIGVAVLRLNRQAQTRSFGGVASLGKGFRSSAELSFQRGASEPGMRKPKPLREAPEKPNIRTSPNRQWPKKAASSSSGWGESAILGSNLAQSICAVPNGSLSRARPFMVTAFYILAKVGKWAKDQGSIPCDGDDWAGTFVYLTRPNTVCQFPRYLPRKFTRTIHPNGYRDIQT
ncbi:hypothetical protein DFH06DRAFT_1138550 [Mycena polygramma]|nr:hypothetical protein DFH06DRAFT_1138550 [Mycena polygramma]